MNIKVNNSPNQQVTAVISHYIRPGRESGYEAWLEGISQVARQFEGHNGVTILRPQPGLRAEYVIILRFNNYHNLWRCASAKQRGIKLKRKKLINSYYFNRQKLK